MEKNLNSLTESSPRQSCVVAPSSFQIQQFRRIQDRLGSQDFSKAGAPVPGTPCPWANHTNMVSKVLPSSGGINKAAGIMRLQILPHPQSFITEHCEVFSENCDWSQQSKSFYEVHQTVLTQWGKGYFACAVRKGSDWCICLGSHFRHLLHGPWRPWFYMTCTTEGTTSICLKVTLGLEFLRTVLFRHIQMKKWLSDSPEFMLLVHVILCTCTQVSWPLFIPTMLSVVQQHRPLLGAC